MSKKTRNLILVFSFILIIISLFINIKTNSYISETKYLNIMLGNSYINTLNQTIFLFLLSVYGLLLGYCFRDILKSAYIVLLTPVFAASAWILTGKILLCTGIPYNAYTSTAAILIVLLAVIVIKKPDLRPVLNLNTLVILLAYASVCLFFSSVDFIILFEDSYTYVILGHSLAENDYLLPSIASFYSARSLLTPLMFTPSSFFGFDFENGFYTLYGFSFNIAICYFIYEELIKKLSKKNSFIITAFVFVTLMFSNLYSLITLVYPISNSIADISMFLALFFIYKAKVDNEKLLYISLIFMICFIWARTESVIIALIFMFFMTNMNFNKSKIIKFELISLLAILLWYTKFFSIAGFDFDEGKFLTITRASLIVCAYISFIIYTIFISKFKFYNKVKSKLDFLPYIAMLLAILAYIFIDFYKPIRNIGATFVNISIGGGWGTTILFMLCLLSIYYYYCDNYDIWDKSLLAYVIAIVFIFLFRKTYLRVGVADSGNRMLTAIIPIVVYIIGTRLMPKFLVKEKQDPLQL